MTSDARYFTTNDGVRLVYGREGEGDGCELVFLHGWCCNRSAFAPQVEYFARGHRTLSLDFRGHGDSAKPPVAPGAYSIETLANDTLAAVRDAAFARPILVGHSLGGLVALACAARAAREGVRAAVLVNPALLFDPAVRAWAQRSVAAIEGDESGAWRKAFAERLMLPTDRAFRADLPATVVVTPAPIAAAAWGAMAGHDPEAALARARAPLLIIHSGGDELRHFTPLASRPGFTLGVTVGAGHFNHLEVPDQVNAMIDRFVGMV